MKTRPESTNYEETSRYDEVLQFLNHLQGQSPLMRQSSFGRSQEGRDLPLVVLADPPVAQPREARDSGKAIVLVLANIHAGEVEGKEAAQNLARRILLGDLKPLLKDLIILLAPIYNADGNERISLTNRVPQNGPIGGVGRRENAQGLDLNRDFIKLEAPESRGLVALLNHWDPHVTVDLHTTDGSYHGYHLTYSIPLNPSTPSLITDYNRRQMMPALAKSMLARHNFRTYYYGNFSNMPGQAAKAEPRAWYAFSPQPRVGINYFGFRNRLCILSETYSYLDFRRRIEVTEAFVEEILNFCARHAADIRALEQAADAETIRRGLNGPPLELGLDFKPKALPKPVELLIGEVSKIKNPRSGRFMTAMVEDKFTRVKMLDYGMFEPARQLPVPRAYLFRPEPSLNPVRENLLAHGITLEELTAPCTLDVESFRIDQVKSNQRKFEGHHELSLSGNYEPQRLEFSQGTILIRTAQPLGLLAACLCEPESDDGLVTWNFLDPLVATGKIYPIYKLMRDASVPCRVIGQ